MLLRVLIKDLSHALKKCIAKSYKYACALEPIGVQKCWAPGIIHTCARVFVVAVFVNTQYFCC